jgi:hypothetical protein
VKIVYKDQPKKEDKQAASLAAAAAIGAWQSVHPNSKQLVVYATREESMAGTIASELDPTALRNALGLEEGATDDEVRVALAAAGLITAPTAPSGGGGAPASEQTGTQAHGGEGQPDNQAPANAGNDPATGQPNQQPAAAPPNGGAPAGTVSPPTQAGGDLVQIDRATLEAMRSGAEAGRLAHTRLVEGDRDRIIDAAIQAGKIMPSRRDHWVAKWAADEQECRTLLTADEANGGLAAGMLPVHAVGHEAPGDNPGGAPTGPAYPPEWLPEVPENAALIAARQAAAAKHHGEGMMR